MIFSMEIIKTHVGEVKLRGSNQRNLRIDFAADPKQPGRMRLCFNQGQNRGVYPGESQYIGFNLQKERLCISGMWVDPMERGTGLADVIVHAGFIFAEQVQNEIEGMGIMRKPLIARKLMSFGFTPISPGILAQVQKGDSRSNEPKIRVKGDAHPLTGDGKWFQIEKGEFLEDPSLPIVPIYTKYTLSDPLQCHSKRMETQERLDGLIRIFPKRAQAAYEIARKY